MPAAAAAQTIVQIIGIVVMSTNFSKNHHLQAIIPAIPNKYTKVEQVEEHTAFIAFDAAEHPTYGKDWTPTAFPLVRGMQWIRLKGDRVTITLQGESRHLPLANSGTLDLPRLKIDCCPSATMRDEFAPPPNGMPKNNQDAAIVDFPTSYEAHGCNGTSGANGPPRADTLVTLPAAKTVRISAGPKKWLVIRGGAHIYIADMPKAYAEGLPPQANIFLSHEDHYTAYYGMITGGTCVNWSKCAVGNRTDCVAQLITNGGSGTPPPPSFILDINCSDSQYP